MVTIETSIDIQRPVETVYAFVADQRHLPRWVASVEEVQVIPDGPSMVGTKATAVGTVLGLKLKATNEITALEPNRFITLKGSAGPATFAGTYRFEAVGAGTRLTETDKVEPAGLLAIAEPLFASQFKKQKENDLRRLKALLEAQPG